jgi:hypothetical protein
VCECIQDRALAIAHDMELPEGVQVSGGNARYVDATLVVFLVPLVLGTRRSTLGSPKPVAGLLRCSVGVVFAS